MRASAAASIIVALCVSGVCEAQNFWVAMNGSDANNGTRLSAPFRTVERALSAARQRPSTRHTSILMLPGIYEVNTTLMFDTGTQDVMITSWDTRHPATISGGTTVPLSRCGNVSYCTILDSTFGDTVLQLWSLGGDGATPTRRFMNPLTQDDYMRYDFLNTTSREATVTAEQAALIQAADISSAYAYVYHSWTSSLATVRAFNATTARLSISSDMPDNIFNYGSGLRYRLVNVVAKGNATTDGLWPGGFHFDKTTRTLTYRPAADEATGDEIRLVVPRLSSIISADAASRVSLVNVHVAFTTAGAEACLASSCDGQSASALRSAAIELNGASQWLLKDIHVAHVGGYAIWITGASRDVMLTHSSITDLGAGGIRIGATSSGAPPLDSITRHVIVQNTNVSDGGHVIESGCGILIQAAFNVTVEHNDIFDLYYTGISTGWTWSYTPTSNSGIQLRKNRIFRIGRGRLSDMGCIYTLGASPQSVIDGNVCFDVQTYSYGGNGLYTDQASQGYVFRNNIVYSVKNSLILQHFGLNNTFENNVLVYPHQANNAIDASNGVFCGLHSAQAYSGWEGLSSFTFRNNILALNNASATLMNGGFERAFANMTFERNCYWSTEIAADSLTFPAWNTEGRHNFTEWQRLGKDAGSVLANPDFEHPTDARTLYNTLSNQSACLHVFTPIDSSDAGSHA
jgi:hypothetical protein